MGHENSLQLTQDVPLNVLPAVVVHLCVHQGVSEIVHHWHNVIRFYVLSRK